MCALPPALKDGSALLQELSSELANQTGKPGLRDDPPGNGGATTFAGSHEPCAYVGEIDRCPRPPAMTAAFCELIQARTESSPTGSTSVLMCRPAAGAGTATLSDDATPYCWPYCVLAVTSSRPGALGDPRRTVDRILRERQLAEQNRDAKAKQALFREASIRHPAAGVHRDPLSSPVCCCSKHSGGGPPLGAGLFILGNRFDGLEINLDHPV